MAFRRRETLLAQQVLSHLPAYFGDAFALVSVMATLFSFSMGDVGECCDDIGTACEGELLSHVVTCLFGMIGDDAIVGDTDGDRLFNALF